MEEAFKYVVQVAGAGIAIVPLFATVFVLNTVLQGLGKFGGFISGIKGQGLRKRASDFREDRQKLREARALGNDRRTLNQWGVRRRAKRQAVIASHEEMAKDARTRFISEEAQKGGAFSQRLAGGGRLSPVEPSQAAQASVLAAAVSAEKKAFQEDVGNMEAYIKVKFDKPEDALKDAMENGNKAQAVAAQNILFSKGGSGVSKFREVVEANEDNAKFGAIEGALRSNTQERHGQYAKQKGADLVKWANSTDSLKSSSAGTLSDNDLAGQHAESINKMIGQNLVSGEQARRMLNDPRVSANLDEKQKEYLANATGGDLRKTPNERELNQAHQEALNEEARRNGGGSGNNGGPSPYL